MAMVRTFRIHPEYGVPDREIRDFLSQCESDMIIQVVTVHIPGSGQINDRLTVIVTKLDDTQMDHLSDEEADLK